MCSPFDSVNKGCQHICTKKVSSLSSVFSFPEIKAVENVVRKSFWVSFNPLNINARQSGCLLLLLSSVFFVRASFATLWTNKLAEKNSRRKCELNVQSTHNLKKLVLRKCSAIHTIVLTVFTSHALHAYTKKNKFFELKTGWCFFNEWFPDYTFRIPFAVTLDDIQELWFFFI